MGGSEGGDGFHGRLKVDVDPSVRGRVVGTCVDLVGRPDSLGEDNEPGLDVSFEVAEGGGDGAVPGLGHVTGRNEVKERHVVEYGL